MIITENGESQSYGVEDGGLFVEMVVTNEIDIRKRKTQEKILNSKKEKISGFVLTLFDLVDGLLFFFFSWKCATYLSATCRI